MNKKLLGVDCDFFTSCDRILTKNIYGAMLCMYVHIMNIYY